MFTHDFSATKHFASKQDGLHAYQTWLAAVGINTEDFPFTVKTGREFKGKPVVFHIMSWGSYQNADSEWVCFVAYYSAPMKHTSQYSWAIDELGMAIGIPRKNEFIGG